MKREDAAAESRVVRVRGMVAEFGVADVEDKLGIDYEDELLADYEDQPVLVAEEVEVVQ